MGAGRGAWTVTAGARRALGGGNSPRAGAGTERNADRNTGSLCARRAGSCGDADIQSGPKFWKERERLDPLTLSDSKTSCNAAVTPAARAGGRAGRQPRGTGRDRAADAGRVRTAVSPLLPRPRCSSKNGAGPAGPHSYLATPQVKRDPTATPRSRNYKSSRKKGHRRLSWRRRGAPTDPATAAAAPLPSTGPLPRRTRHGRQSRCGWGARLAPRGPPLPRDSRGCHTFPSLSTAQTTMRLL